ncbi:MAG: O-antigen ligase family protein [Bacteroides graminisolvens]|nr:O-antigen ligase family protein [Bacteroides graminisolvens]
MLKIENVFYLLIPLLIIGIPFHYSVFPLCVAALVIRCITSERTTIAAFLLLYAGPTIGCIRSIYPALPVYGLFFQLLGLILAWDELHSFFSRSRKGIMALLFVFAIFSLSYYMGCRNEVAQIKYLGIIQNGIYSFIGFYILCTSKKLNNEQFTHMLVMTSLVMMQYLITKYSLPVGTLFDYNWFRASSEIIRIEHEHSIVNYQHIGMNTAFAFAIFMSQNTLNIKKILFYMIFCGQLVLMAGARQAIVSVVFILILRYLFFNKRQDRISLKQIAFSVLLIWGIYWIIGLLEIDSFKLFLEKGNDRSDYYLAATAIFNQYPFFGAGMGGFYQITGENYPHNIIYELMAECGLIGIVSIITLTSIFILKNKIKLRQMTMNNSYIFIILLSLCIRCMISGDFSISIQLFSALFMIPGAIFYQNNNLLEKHIHDL